MSRHLAMVKTHFQPAASRQSHDRRVRHWDMWGASPALLGVKSASLAAQTGNSFTVWRPTHGPQALRPRRACGPPQCPTAMLPIWWSPLRQSVRSTRQSAQTVGRESRTAATLRLIGRTTPRPP
jgi:hypothetical protein